MKSNQYNQINESNKYRNIKRKAGKNCSECLVFLHIQSYIPYTILATYTYTIFTYMYKDRFVTNMVSKRT